ncbi:MAG: 6-phosphogluconolactonase [Hyphomonadaceae bacterium]
MGAGPHVFPDRAALMHAAADEIEHALARGQAQRGHGYAALSGGATPAPAYALLAQRALDWPAVTFALVDERCVPPTHPASNEVMLRRALAPALAQGASLLPMFHDAPTLDEAAARADALYAPIPFDIALMGMGADGHTASWFAGADGLAAALDPNGARTVCAIRAPQAQSAPQRLTLTFAALKRIPNVPLVIAGREKHDRLAQAYMDDAAGPVAALFQLTGGAFKVFYAD